MAIPVSASINQLNAEVFIQEGYELSLDAIVPSIELTGSFSQTTSKTQFYIYNYAKTLLYENLNYNANGSFLLPESGTTISNSSSSYNQFELNPIEDIYNQGYSSGNYYALYNFVDYELGSEFDKIDNSEDYNGHPYFIKDISGDRTELRIQNNFLSTTQIESYYQQFINKINARENADEFYVSFENNRNFIGVNSQLELPSSGSNTAASILIKLYKPLPLEFEVDQQLQIISKVGETQVFSIDFQPNLEFVDNLLQLKGPNYNIDFKDKINNSTNFKNLNDLINTNSSQSYYQFNSLKNQKGIILRKNWGDWNEFVKYSSAEQRLRNFKDKLTSIESYEDELRSLETIGGSTPGSPTYSSSYNNVTNNINKIVSKFDSYEYYLYYVTGSGAWPKRTTTYPYANYSVTSSEALNWFGSTNENSTYYNSGKNQIYSASIYDENNQDYLYYLIPPFITDNSSNDQYIKFVNMVGQTFDEIYIYTEGVEQVRNTNSGLTGSVLPLGLADEVIESLGFDTYGNNFNSIGFNPNGVGVFPADGSGLEYITRYVDIASGSVVNYYDQQQSTLGYVIALSDPSFPYPIENSAQEIYKRIFHNMVSLVKRKGTITGLRQLINVWGVPSTMLRISEFGGKNKDDENDYDLWMNRYSNALTTYNYKEGALLPSGSIRIPWTPLTSNYVETATTPDIAVPDCIQFRFKNDRPISQEPGHPDSLFTCSLLVKNSENAINYSDFGIVLQYSGSNSGSFSGSALPLDYQYGTMQFIIEGDVAEGAIAPGYFESDPISLPFFDGGWWSVQLQRKIHLSASNEDNNANIYELKVANNIYDGYDGNQIGFQGSTSIIMNGGPKPSINEAWNKFKKSSTLPSARGVILGGYMTWPNASGLNNTIVGGSGGRSLGTGFSGSFQEFRYYRRALSSSQFNDYVMNPESIQGHSDSNTGEGSSYDLLSFRLPLGNELEYVNMSGSAGFSTATENTKTIGVLKFGGTPNFLSFPSFGANALGSVHPSLVNKKGSLYTSSFLYMTNYNTGSGYNIVYQGWDGTDTAAITASYLAPNTEINYMDQPAAGIRNRIKNKIQVIDGNEYGTILSPFRSIQQEFEQSSSYTEDLNSLEVGFSFQNEINDDIIATFGHGVVSDAIADPRFISESSDRYPELTRIAEDYFKKYQGVTITDPTYNGGLPTIIEKEYDYNRLIKFYETSLFKAIKNYVPARTSLSTGIIVKQHLLERNKATTVPGININTPIAKTPETGSNVYGYTDQTGFNSVISQRNLLITSSIPIGSLTGSAGGSVNKYNIITNEGQFYKNVSSTLKTLSLGSTYDLYDTLPPANPALNIKIATALDSEGKVFQQSEVAFRSQLRWKPSFTGIPLTNCAIVLEATSSKRGGIFSTEFPYNVSSGPAPPSQVSNNFVEIYPDERIYWRIGATGQILQMNAYIFQFGESADFAKPEPLASQQVNWYIDDFTGEYKVDDYQTEFYDGEFSGSNFEVIPTQYNPYRIFADGNDKTPDTLPIPSFDLNNAVTSKAGTGLTSTGLTLSGVTKTTITITTDAAVSTALYYIVGAFENLIPGRGYNVSGSITAIGNGAFVGPALPAIDAGGFVPDAPFNRSNTAPRQFNVDFIATDLGSAPGVTQPFTSGPGSGFDNGGFQMFFLSVSQPQSATFELYSISALGSLGGKHFYERDAFTIVPSQSQLFQNSPYNPTINNVSGSRESSFYYDMDFDPINPGSELKEGIPSDYTLLVSASQLGWEGANPTADDLLEYAEVPDSNYTTKAIINPRYVGTTLESADYNFYTGIPSESLFIARSRDTGITGLANPPFLLTQNKVRYINGETGSWGGDISYGKTAVIDRNPIFFAHFKSSLESKEYYNTTTFNIDQLIQVPFEEILSEQSPIITSSLINGSNENLIPMSSTFMPERKATIVYNQTTKTFNNIGGTVITYTNLGVGSQVINAGGIEFIAYQSNERALDVLTTDQFYNLPKWYSYTKGLANINQKNNAIANTFNSASIHLTSSIFSQSNGVNQVELDLQNDLSNVTNTANINNPGNTEFYTKSPAVVMAYTGRTKDSNNQDVGLIDLRGPNVGNIPGIAFADGSLTNNALILQGQSLLLFNSINNLISLGDINKDEYVGGNPSQQYADNITIPLPAGGDPLGISGISNEASPMVSYPLIPSSQVIPNPFQPFNTQPQTIWGKGSLPILTQQDLEFEDNFFRWNISGSNLLEYRNIDDQKILIEKGDEIRVSYAYFPNSSNSTITNKTYQDFTVLGYDQYPPLLWTSNLDPSAHAGGYSDIRFEIACYKIQGYGAGNNTQTVFINPLPATGYYSFSSLKEKYQAAMHNNVIMYWQGVELGGAAVFASGSIVGVSSHSEVNGTGIIGITASWFTPGGSADDFNNETYGTMFGSNYILQDLDSNQFPMSARDGLGFPLTTPVFMSSSINPMIQDDEGFNQVLDPGYLFNRLKVTPNPADLDIPIVNGKIYAMTLRKRQEADDRVVLNVNQPSGSQGALTLSGDGYLIPNDLTNIQQRNVQKIINKLQSENVFQQNTPNDVR